VPKGVGLTASEIEHAPNHGGFLWFAVENSESPAQNVTFDAASVAPSR
jgi:hypothetical protein